MAARRVAITGIGLTTSLGRDREETWKAVCRGNCGIRRLTADDFPGEYRKVAPEYGDWMFGAPVSLPRLQGTSRLIQIADRVADEAVGQRGGIDDVPPDRRGVVLGTSKTDLFQIHVQPEALWAGHACSHVAQRLNCQAASLAPVAACATGLVSMIRAAELVATGQCDLVLAGAVDASLHPAVLGSYRRLGVLAKPGADGRGTCQPFDRNRSGFAIGEGGAVLILEPWNQAVERGKPLAEWVGGCSACDPSGIAQVDASGVPLYELCQRLLRKLRIDAAQIDGIALHGTATIPNDLAESRAMEALLERRLQNIPATAVKGAIGHLLGAAGAVESALTVLGLRDSFVPPVVGLAEQDPASRLFFAREVTEFPNLNTVLKVSLGFGGHLAAGIIRRVE